MYQAAPLLGEGTPEEVETPATGRSLAHPSGVAELLQKGDDAQLARQLNGVCRRPIGKRPVARLDDAGHRVLVIECRIR